ncbi:MAG: SGNH/GDSL hydrolase family protein [Ferruginibacter sp.]
MFKTYLALGDSYTIGEQVPLFDSFPYQFTQLLRKQNPQESWLAPEIVAKTGWTTDELLQQIDQTQLLPKYDLVTLLIGVNNQYRGRTVANYKEEYAVLLKKAIAFAGGNPNLVVVLSIPDWGKTPFAQERDIAHIEQEIDAYNLACKQITEAAGARFIDITTSQRADAHDLHFMAADGLHPSGKEYAKWAGMLVDSIRNL